MDVPLANTTVKCSLYSYAFIMIISELVYKFLKMRYFYIYYDKPYTPTAMKIHTLQRIYILQVYEKETSGKNGENSTQVVFGESIHHSTHIAPNILRTLFINESNQHLLTLSARRHQYQIVQCSLLTHLVQTISIYFFRRVFTIYMIIYNQLPIQFSINFSDAIVA